VVGEQAVDLLGHAQVTGADPRLHVGNRDMQFNGGQRRRQSGINISHHDYQVRLPGQQHFLKLDHDLPGLPGMAAGAYAKVDIRRRQIEVLKEDLRHLVIVMLAGVDEQRLYRVCRGRGIMLQDGTHERGYLHEVGACGGDKDDFHD